MAGASRSLLQSEISQLRGYRTAAKRLHGRLSPFASHQFRAHLFRETEPDEAELIPDNDFLALLVAFRIVFADQSPAHFGRICNLAHKAGDDEIRRVTAIVRAGWKQSFEFPMQAILHEQTLSSAEILHAWMNGEVFHQDTDLARSVELIKHEGAVSLMMLQLTVWMASYNAVSLDGICAILLDEPTMPLLNPPPNWRQKAPGQPDAG